MAKRKRTVYLLLFITLLALISLPGCGGKSQEKVVEKIEKKMMAVDGYKAKAQMKMQTGREDRVYDIEIWFKKGETNNYRVALMNEADESKQIILKNEDGVYVLTPLLKKSFKFQSDWPENSGQPYLYQSLVNDVALDKEATFTVEDAAYIFDTKTNYVNNKNLAFQQIYFNKKTLLPTAVRIMDENRTPLVEVVFNEIDVDATFAADDFDRDAILSKLHEDKETSVVADETDSFEVLLPLVTKGAELVEKKEVPLENGVRIIMTFKGERNFTLIQEHKYTVPAATMDEIETKGEIVHLGHSIGAITDNSIEWNYQGSDFYLASEEMTMDELIDVASSVQGREIK